MMMMHPSENIMATTSSSSSSSSSTPETMESPNVPMSQGEECQDIDSLAGRCQEGEEEEDEDEDIAVSDEEQSIYELRGCVKIPAITSDLVSEITTPTVQVINTKKSGSRQSKRNRGVAGGGTTGTTGTTGNTGTSGGGERRPSSSKRDAAESKTRTQKSRSSSRSRSKSGKSNRASLNRTSYRNKSPEKKDDAKRPKSSRSSSRSNHRRSTVTNTTKTETETDLQASTSEHQNRSSFRTSRHRRSSRSPGPLETTTRGGSSGRNSRRASDAGGRPSSPSSLKASVNSARGTASSGGSGSGGGSRHYRRGSHSTKGKSAAINAESGKSGESGGPSSGERWRSTTPSRYAGDGTRNSRNSPRPDRNRSHHNRPETESKEFTPAAPLSAPAEPPLASGEDEWKENPLTKEDQVVLTLSKSVLEQYIASSNQQDNPESERMFSEQLLAAYLQSSHDHNHSSMITPLKPADDTSISISMLSTPAAANTRSASNPVLTSEYSDPIPSRLQVSSPEVLRHASPAPQKVSKQKLAPPSPTKMSASALLASESASDKQKLAPPYPTKVSASALLASDSASEPLFPPDNQVAAKSRSPRGPVSFLSPKKPLISKMTVQPLTPEWQQVVPSEEKSKSKNKDNNNKPKQKAKSWGFLQSLISGRRKEGRHDLVEQTEVSLWSSATSTTSSVAREQRTPLRARQRFSLSPKPSRRSIGATSSTTGTAAANSIGEATDTSSAKTKRRCKSRSTNDLRDVLNKSGKQKPPLSSSINVSTTETMDKSSSTTKRNPSHSKQRNSTKSFEAANEQALQHARTMLPAVEGSMPVAEGPRTTEGGRDNQSIRLQAKLSSSTSKTGAMTPTSRSHDSSVDSSNNVTGLTPPFNRSNKAVVSSPAPVPSSSNFRHYRQSLPNDGGLGSSLPSSRRSRMCDSLDESPRSVTTKNPNSMDSNFKTMGAVLSSSPRACSSSRSLGIGEDGAGSGASISISIPKVPTHFVEPQHAPSTRMSRTLS